MKTKLELDNTTILITGAAGFIGAALAQRLLRERTGARVIGLDDMNDYYDPALKEHRLAATERAAAGGKSAYLFHRGSIADKALVDALFREYRPGIVVNLAAQAGVRYSIECPEKYIQSNIVGFFNILEACRHSYDGGAKGVEHLVYASSSSVYGGNKKVPFSVDDRVDGPVSLYAATKKSDELLAHSYAKLYDIPSTGLRFFTVYGPAGRPDMFYYSAAGKLARGEAITLFNHGDMKRDFTYIDDIVEGVVRVMQGAPERKRGEDGLPVPPYALYNIGGSHPEDLRLFVTTLHEELIACGVLPPGHDLQACVRFSGMQPGDVPVTWADSEALEKDYGFTPSIGIREGLHRFAAWYRDYYDK